MAPSLVHFLAGATLALFVATPLALRGRLARRHLWLVAIGGLWGMAPDGNYVTPVFESQLAALHNSQWANVFAGHHALDRPAFATRALASTGVAVTGFVVGVFGFSSAAIVGERDRRDTRSPRNRLLTRALLTGYAAILSGALAGVCAGFVFAHTGRMEPLAALWGRESATAGWVFLLACSLGASGAFALVLEALDHQWPVLHPTFGAGIGLAGAVIAWGTVVAVAVPIWMRVALELPRPIPYLHLASLAGLVVFGLVVGLVYPTTRRVLDSPVASR